MLRKIFFFKPSPPISPSSSLQSKTFSDSLMEENIETARTLITKWNPFPASNCAKTTPILFTNTHHEAKEFLKAVKRLHSTMMHLITQDSSSEKLVKAQSLMQCAMKRLEMEFYRILAQTRDGLDPKSLSGQSSIINEDWVERDSVSTAAIMDLKAIAECMVSAGYSKECVRVYIMVRKPIVDEAMYLLGVERLSFSQFQKMEWEVIESRIKCWLSAVKLAFGTLFPGERNLCDYIFGSPERKVAESCLTETCRDAAACLFGFAENVAKCKKTPEKMFRTLDLYEAISEHRQQIESIFSSAIRTHATAVQARLAEAVRKMLSDFESAIQKESSKIPVPGGGIHPLTRYAMNYTAFLADYSDALAEIVTDWPQSPLPESYYGDENSTPPSETAEMLAWLILVILCKLDGKAKLYKDTALSYLFLANNMQYVVVKVRKSNLGFLLGEDWLTKHEAKVKEYASKYERVGWSNVLQSLPENPTAEEAVAIFQSFNAAFVEACGAQSSWVVPDPKLRQEIKASIGLKVVVRYRKFYERNRVGSESVIRFSPDDLENCLSVFLRFCVGRNNRVPVIGSKAREVG
ncbi:exocyst complex component EXO70H1-like [Lotus japonicus]|uniref:exocyst complex component EXO70H1-like n=1 Tax=Lotus japonicus TaxID=34305 RepID=UPI002583497C|nr:exocyst complex component EXO70H1-like [Lotus japonicus]